MLLVRRTAPLLSFSSLPVTDGLVGASPVDTAGVRCGRVESYLIKTLTGVESVRPSSAGSVWASAPDVDFGAAYVESGDSVAALKRDAESAPACNHPGNADESQQEPWYRS